MKKIIIILSIFFFDRFTKIYLINLQSTGTDIDFYIFTFLDFNLIWNSGIGFGLAAMETNIYYHILIYQYSAHVSYYIVDLYYGLVLQNIYP